jgi:hypothetical protein
MYLVYAVSSLNISSGYLLTNTVHISPISVSYLVPYNSSLFCILFVVFLYGYLENQFHHFVSTIAQPVGSMEQLNICMFKSYNPSQICHIIFSIDLFRSTEKYILIYYTESTMIHANSYREGRV